MSKNDPDMSQDDDEPAVRQAPPPRPHDPILRRRGDNVGQSGRWYRADDGMTDAERHYGHEERWHSTDHPAGLPHWMDGPEETPFGPWKDKGGAGHGEDNASGLELAVGGKQK